jgi:hypothetical protein
LNRRGGRAYQSLNSKPECFKIKEKNAVVANNFAGMGGRPGFPLRESIEPTGPARRPSRRMSQY